VTAAEPIKHVDDQMPVILDPKDYEFSLDRSIETVPALKEWLRPAPGNLFVAQKAANAKQPQNNNFNRGYLQRNLNG